MVTFWAASQAAAGDGIGSYLPLITGSGGCLIALAIGCWLLLTGKLHSHAEFGKLEQERDYWRDAYRAAATAIATERETVNDQADAGQVNVRVIEALAGVIAGRKTEPAALTAKDLGL